MDRRISREQAFMQTAEVWAQRSTCGRRAVGAVVVVGNHIVATAYNGAPAGEAHCDFVTCVPPGQVGCMRAVHAERNAILYTPHQFKKISKTIYTTESPCSVCAQLIYENHFTDVYYLNQYRIEDGIKFLIRQGVRVRRMTPAGIILRKGLDENGNLTEELVDG